MGMVADMILAVAMVAVAPGAITELQIRMAHIGTAADGAFMIISLLLGSASAGELDGLSGRLLGRISLRLLFLSGSLHPPGQRQHILDVSAKEQEIVCQRHQGEQIIREQEIRRRQRQHLIRGDAQIEQRKDPRPHGNDKEQQEVGIRVQGGIAQEQAQVQILPQKFMNLLVGVKGTVDWLSR